MFTAIHKITGQLVNSIDPNYSVDFFKNEEWLAVPTIIENCNVGVDKNTISMSYRSQSREIISKKTNKIYKNSPHFFCPEATRLGIIFKPYTKEHTKCVDFIYNLMNDGKLKLLISKSTKPSERDNIIELDMRNIDWSRFDTEVTIKNEKSTRRADILLPFKKYDDFLGFGIVIEIQLTEQRDTTRVERSYDRANKKYSVSWIAASDFIDFKNENLELINDYIQIVDYMTIMKDYKIEMVEDIKERTINYHKMLDKKEEEFLESINKKTIEYFNTLNKRDAQITKQVNDKMNEQSLIISRELNLLNDEDIKKEVTKYLSIKATEIYIAIKAEEHTCPRCKESKLSLQNGIYGYFLACNNKCGYTKGVKIDGIYKA